MKIPNKIISQCRMLVLDSDGVSVPIGTKINEKVLPTTYEVNVCTNLITDKLARDINKLKRYIKICISSGRSLIYLQNMYSKVMGGGVILQAENGNLSMVNGLIIQHESYDDDYFLKLATIKREISKLDILGFEPKQFILTVHTQREIGQIYDIVSKYDLNNELSVLWNGEAFDIQKGNTNKGNGIRGLSKYLDIDLEDIIAIGDKGNDKELVSVVGYGVSTNNETLRASAYMTCGELVNQVLWRKIEMPKGVPKKDGLGQGKRLNKGRGGYKETREKGKGYNRR